MYKMGTQYKAEFKKEAIKLSEEIGTKAASERLEISADTLYTWISKAKKQNKKVTEIVESKGVEGLVMEIEELRNQLREQEEEIEILQDAMGFFIKRRKK